MCSTNLLQIIAIFCFLFVSNKNIFFSELLLMNVQHKIERLEKEDKLSSSQNVNKYIRTILPPPNKSETGENDQLATFYEATFCLRPYSQMQSSGFMIRNFTEDDIFSRIFTWSRSIIGPMTLVSASFSQWSRRIFVKSSCCKFL